jgi:hypothetical protein
VDARNKYGHDGGAASFFKLTHDLIAQQLEQGFKKIYEGSSLL